MLKARQCRIKKPNCKCLRKIAAIWDLGEAEMARRKEAWEPHPSKAPRGVLAKYARNVGSASEGALTG